MGTRLRRRSSSSSVFSALEEPEEEDGGELQWPFGRLDTLTRDELKETAYELFFTCFRSSSGGRPRDGSDAGTKASSPGRGGLTPATSRVKDALGLRAKPSVPVRTTVSTSASGSLFATLPQSAKGKPRPMTSAEILRTQMGFTEQTDGRLRKILMRFLVGQVAKQVETIILPLELLRHLRPVEFGDPHEYQRWQHRQLKVLEAGLLLHSSVPTDRLHPAGLRLREIVSASEFKPIDTSKHSEAMRALCNCAMSLAWRHQSVAPVEVCHWADGFPLNVHLYLCLFRSIFDLREPTIVLEELDELLELIKKTWTTLGINKMIHDVCFTWILFEQYIVTGLVESDLMDATLAMLDEVAINAKQLDREPSYMKVLMPTMTSLKLWAEKQLLNYHECFDKDVTMMDSVLCLAVSATKIVREETSSIGSVGMIVKHDIREGRNLLLKNCVDQYIRTSVKSAFTKVYDHGKFDNMVVEVDEDPNDTMINLTKATESIAFVEKAKYSPLLKRWHPIPRAIAAVTLHSCFGAVLRQYMYKFSCLTKELANLLKIAGNLEKLLIQMVTEEAAESEEDGKEILHEITAYGVDSLLFKLTKHWVDDRLGMARQCINSAKESENWNPVSKSEPYAESAVNIMNITKVTVDEFFEIQVEPKDTEVAKSLADGLDTIFKDYILFVASCGSKESYIPALPPLTRCNQDSRVSQLWKKAAAPCSAGVVAIDPSSFPIPRTAHEVGDAHRHTASRSTQRLYVRLNTLNHILHYMDDKSSSCKIQIEGARSSIHAAILHVAEVASYRLIFLDSAHFFYDSLYMGSVIGARVNPALRALSHNIAHLSVVLKEPARAKMLREVLRASLEAFLMVVLAGGSGRAFSRADFEMVAEDLASLKRLFAQACAEDAVAEAAAAAEGVVALMAIPTEKLVEEFSIAACEASGLGRSLERVPMPPTTGRWHRSDPNTMLRILCHRDDDAANRFLRRTFQLPKRK
ncbi:protein unc-13 homolog [Zingiber officinale]|uniref:protein unc-13 homolog n=1 Tax=Zingiber officinale TaxID=94328 RepID=UPI001C4D8EE8|nr:protein unc-13 homolog [Zingiber officinale]